MRNKTKIIMIKTRNLITGGSGFLGSHLKKKLLKEGEEVICLDNFFTETKYRGCIKFKF